MKTFTKLLIPLLTITTLSCSKPKQEDYIRGKIRIEHEYPLDKRFDMEFPSYQGHTEKGAISGNYFVTVGKDNYDIYVLANNESEIDSIIKTLNKGDSIKFKNKPTFQSILYFLGDDTNVPTSIPTKRGDWKLNEIEVIK